MDRQSGNRREFLLREAGCFAKGLELRAECRRGGRCHGPFILLSDYTSRNTTIGLTRTARAAGTALAVSATSASLAQG